jgi:hypothetical protein
MSLSLWRVLHGPKPLMRRISYKPLKQFPSDGHASAL